MTLNELKTSIYAKIKNYLNEASESFDIYICFNEREIEVCGSIEYNGCYESVIGGEPDEVLEEWVPGSIEIEVEELNVIDEDGNEDEELSKAVSGILEDVIEDLEQYEY